MFRKTLIVWLIPLLFLPSVVSAKVDITELKTLGFPGFESTNTDSPDFFFKRLQEEFIIRFLKRDQKSKDTYMAVLLDKRYRELVYVASNGQTGIFENTVRRYETTSGKLISKSNALTPALKTQARNYLKVLERVRDNYPANSAYWIMVQETIDTTKRLL